LRCEQETFDYDVLAWKKDRYVKPLSNYRSDPSVTYRFSIPEDQASTIRTFQAQYGTHMDGIGRMLTRINQATLKLQINEGSTGAQQNPYDPVELFQMPSAESHA
jgi:hypothetical protein